MRKTARRLAKLALSTAVALAPLMLCGCENAHRLADQKTSDQSQDLQSKRIKATTPVLLRQLTSQYDQLAADPEISEYTRAQLLGQAGQVHLQLAIMLRSDLRDAELKVARSIADLQQLALQVASTQADGKALAGNDPADLLKANAQAQTDNKAAMDKLDASLAANNTTLKALQDKDAQLLSQRTQSLADAEKLLAQSHGESGAALTNDLIQSAQKRRDAAVEDAQRATLASQIAHLQQQIALGTASKDTLAAYAKALTDQVQVLNDCWQQIGEQIKAQQTAAQQIIAGGFTAVPQDEQYKDGKVTSVVRRLANLKERLDEAAALRKDALEESAKADSFYGKAAKLAGSFRSELVTESRSPDASGKVNVQAPIYMDLAETLHPDYYKSEQALAELTSASVKASAVILQKEMFTLLNGFSLEGKAVEAGFARFKVTGDGGKPVLGLTALLESQGSGSEKAKELIAQLAVPAKEEISAANEAVDKLFADADALVGNPAAVGGASAELRKTGMARRQAAINRQWAVFDRFIGSPNAANHDDVAQKLEETLKEQEPAVAPAVYTAPAEPAPAAPATPATPAAPTTQPAESPTTAPAAPGN